MPKLANFCLQSISAAKLTPVNVYGFWYCATAFGLNDLKRRAMEHVWDNLNYTVKQDSEGRLVWGDSTSTTPDMLVDFFFYIGECTKSKPDRLPKRETRLDKPW